MAISGEEMLCLRAQVHEWQFACSASGQWRDPILRWVLERVMGHLKSLTWGTSKSHRLVVMASSSAQQRQQQLTTQPSPDIPRGSF